MGPFGSCPFEQAQPIIVGVATGFHSRLLSSLPFAQHFHRCCCRMFEAVAATIVISLSARSSAPPSAAIRDSSQTEANCSPPDSSRTSYNLSLSVKLPIVPLIDEITTAHRLSVSCLNPSYRLSTAQLPQIFMRPGRSPPEAPAHTKPY